MADAGSNTSGNSPIKLWMVLSSRKCNFCYRKPSQIPADSHGASLLSFTCKLDSVRHHIITSISQANFAKRHVGVSPIKILPFTPVIHASTLSAISAINLIRTYAPAAPAISSMNLSTIPVSAWVDTLQLPPPVCLAAMQQPDAWHAHTMILTTAPLPTTLLFLHATSVITQPTTSSMAGFVPFALLTNASSAPISQLVELAQQAIAPLSRWPVWFAT